MSMSMSKHIHPTREIFDLLPADERGRLVMKWAREAAKLTYHARELHAILTEMRRNGLTHENHTFFATRAELFETRWRLRQLHRTTHLCTEDLTA